MKRLIKKAEVDINRYKDKFIEHDSDVTYGRDRGGDNAEFSVIYRLNKTNESPQEWIEVCDYLMSLNLNEAIGLVGLDEIKASLTNCGALDVTDQDIQQNYNDKSDTWVEITFSVTQWVEDEDN